MALQMIIDSLSRLEKLHQSLLLLSQQKTEVLKNGEMDALQSLLVHEQKYIQAINQVEKSRQKAVEAWLAERQEPFAEATVTYLLEQTTDVAEKESLEKRFTKLTNVLVQLKQQEQLNRQLTRQSLQFIELSIDMLSPTMKNLNYNQPKKQPVTQQARYMFDSQA